MQARAELERLINSGPSKSEEECLKELQKKAQEAASLRLKKLLSELSEARII